MTQETPDQKPSVLTHDERKEKLLLEFNYLKSLLLDSDKDNTDRKEIKRIMNDFEKELEDFFEIKVSAKNKKDYVNFKRISIDKSMLRYAKFLK